MHETPPPKKKKWHKWKKIGGECSEILLLSKKRWCVELTRCLLQMDQWGHGNLLGEYGTEMTLEGASN